MEKRDSGRVQGPLQLNSFLLLLKKLLYSVQPLS
jgi:hypothetical protein